MTPTALINNLIVQDHTDTNIRFVFDLVILDESIPPQQNCFVNISKGSTAAQVNLAIAQVAIDCADALGFTILPNNILQQNFTGSI